MSHKPLLRGRGWRTSTLLITALFLLMFLYAAITLLQALTGGA